jgi:hypothetical protein
MGTSRHRAYGNRHVDGLKTIERVTSYSRKRQSSLSPDFGMPPKATPSTFKQSKVEECLAVTCDEQ